jgi:hypothetical protein
MTAKVACHSKTAGRDYISGEWDHPDYSGAEGRASHGIWVDLVFENDIKNSGAAFAGGAGSPHSKSLRVITIVERIDPHTIPDRS